MKRIPGVVSTDRGVEVPDCGGGASVVLRVRCVVSAEGGGGRDVRVEARHRKHSPLPK